MFFLRFVEHLPQHVAHRRRRNNPGHPGLYTSRSPDSALSRFTYRLATPVRLFVHRLRAQNAFGPLYLVKKRAPSVNSKRPLELIRHATADAIMTGAVKAIEVTRTTPGALRPINRAIEAYNSELAFVAGSVPDPDSALVNPQARCFQEAVEQGRSEVFRD